MKHRDDSKFQGSGPQYPRRIQRTTPPEEDEPVVVDSSAFFRADTHSHPKAQGSSSAPRRRSSSGPARSAQPAPHPPKRGYFMLFVQALLTIAALVQLYRTQMLPLHYLVILGALLGLIWLLFWQCQ